MVDKNEALVKFVKQNYRITLEKDFKEKLYKNKKKEYFSDLLKNAVGIPKDTEIANKTLDYLIRINHIQNKGDLESTLAKPFFARLKNILDPEIYLQKLEIKEKRPDLDPSLIHEEEYKTQKYEEIKEQVLKESTRAIEERIKEATAIYQSIPSVLDQQENIPEPMPVEHIEATRYDPWWKRMGLISNPFPTYDGLGNISDSLYERIIIITDIYEKFVHHIHNFPSELFKNIVFYGEFGSGKTTLFEYLKKPLVKNHIYPAFIRISAEPDYQSFLMRFKNKLQEELVGIFYNLTGNNIATNLESMSVDGAIVYALKLIQKQEDCNGFVIFVDDIYKPPDYEKTALKFLNHLQTFKAELTQQMRLPNIGFFISAPPDWESILNEKQAYSGSVSQQEHMPRPTVEQARSMLNERLAAFAPNREKYREIKIDFAHQVYRTLESRKSFTFRQFIKECLNRFETGNFEILTSNPVSLSHDTFKNIIQCLRTHTKVHDGISEILNSPASNRNKAECFQLLVQIFNEKSYSEDSDTFKEKKYYFKELRNAGLIIKGRNSQGITSWYVSREMIEFSNDVFNKYAYYLDDYFLKLFADKLEMKQSERVIPTRREFGLYEDLKTRLRKKNDGTSSLVKSSLDEAFNLHKKIVDEIDAQIDTPSIHLSYNQLEKDCSFSIGALSDAVAHFAGIPANGTDIWIDFYYYPETLSAFKKRQQTLSSQLKPSSIYLYTAYENAFSEMLNYLSEQAKKKEIIDLPFSNLTTKEREELDNARSECMDGEYITAAGRISTLVENKLREFIYSIFLLQYGDRHHRLQHIPRELYSYITENPKKDEQRGFAHSDNELTYLNRHQYYSIILGPKGVGSDNWRETFSQIFTGWDFSRMHSYLDLFFRYNLTSSHNKTEVFRPEHQSDISQYLRDSVSLLVKMNQSYHRYLKMAQKLETPGSTELAYYFSLKEFKDKFVLRPVPIDQSTKLRIIESLKTSKTSSFDLSYPAGIEQKYGIPYREVFAVLADLMACPPSGLEIRTIKRNDPIIVLRVK